MTKEERNNYIRVWRKANPEKYRAIQKAYYEKNAEKKIARVKAWKKANPEKFKAHKQAYRKANPEKFRAIQKAYYENNAEKINQRIQVWKKANPEKVKNHKQTYCKSNPEKVKRSSLIARLKRAGLSSVPRNLINLKVEYLTIKQQINESKKHLGIYSSAAA